MSATTTTTPSPVPAALRVAMASVICFAISASFHLDLPYQSLITVYIVNLTYPLGSFQKGIERLIGRVGGVLYGAIVAVTIGTWPGLTILAVVLFQLVVWYLNAAERLPYAGIHLGLFSATTAAIGLLATPAVAVDTAIATATQIVLGVFVAEIVNILASDTGPLRIDTGTNPIFPLRKAWVLSSVRVTLASLGALFLAGTFALPVLPTMISAMLITQAGDPAAAEWKAYLRMLGAITGVLYCWPVLTLLSQVPSLGLLIGFIFLGVFLGQLLAHTSTDYGYLGFQFGLTIGLILAGKPADLQDIEVGLHRIVGVVGGTMIAIIAVAAFPPPKPTQ